MKNILNLLPLLLMVATATVADPPKNIVLILADDLGWADTTLYGKTSLFCPNGGGFKFSCVHSEALADLATDVKTELSVGFVTPS